MVREHHDWPLASELEQDAPAAETKPARPADNDQEGWDKLVDSLLAKENDANEEDELLHRDFKARDERQFELLPEEDPTGMLSLFEAGRKFLVDIQ